VHGGIVLANDIAPQTGGRAARRAVVARGLHVSQADWLREEKSVELNPEVRHV
jgi:hypothetical protein